MTVNICGICEQRFDTFLGVLFHIRNDHPERWNPEQIERWPDGEPVVHAGDITPQDFGAD